MNTLENQPQIDIATATSKRRLVRVVTAQTMSNTQAFTASSIGRGNLGEGVDPFIQIDHFFMGDPVFSPHPHTGFSAVTYMFENSEGTFINRDTMSAKDSVLIRPGDLHWTQAGSGMIHEEKPTEPGKICHGLQIFVNLAAANKFSQPQAFHLAAKDIPTYEDGKGKRIRVLVGEAFGLSSPLTTLTPVTLLDAFLPAEERIEHTIPNDQNTFVLVIDGSGRFEPNGKLLASDKAGLFSNDGESILVKAGSQGLHYVLCSGSPLEEPIVSRGPFVMNSLEQIQQVQNSYLAGEMGKLN